MHCRLNAPKWAAFGVPINMCFLINRKISTYFLQINLIQKIMYCKNIGLDDTSTYGENEPTINEARLVVHECLCLDTWHPERGEQLFYT